MLKWLLYDAFMSYVIADGAFLHSTVFKTTKLILEFRCTGTGVSIYCFRSNTVLLLLTLN